jgi:hypothetical protein
MWHLENKMRTVWGSIMNWWCCTTARKHVHTRFKLLRNLFENRQTVAQTVKPPHTRSNSLRNSLCCANCLIVYGALNGTDLPSHTKHAWKQVTKAALLFRFHSMYYSQHVIRKFPGLWVKYYSIHYFAKLNFKKLSAELCRTSVRMFNM